MELTMYAPGGEHATRWREVWRPSPRRSMADWAEAKFCLSPEPAAEPRRWTTLWYQRGIMEAVTDPFVTRVSVMKSARVGYTKIINATIGYYIHQDPCPIMVVQPTIDDAEGYSKEEIAPMLREVPVLSALIPESKSKDSGSTILHKRFSGGSLSLVGANSGRGSHGSVATSKVKAPERTDLNGFRPRSGR